MGVRRVLEGGARPPSPFGYTGELQDAATHLQYLRARTYNPATGQFLQRDPLEQQTGQAYLYAGGDPVDNSDPSGQCYVVDRGGRRIGALPDVNPDDKNCAPSTVVSYALQPGHGPTYYPTTADVNCLYAQILRRVKGAAPLLRKGFYVSPAQHSPSILQDFTGGLGFLVRQATGLVGVGENALAVGEEVAQGTGRIITAAPKIPPVLLGAAVLATALYIVTDPATPAGGDYPPVSTDTRVRDRGLFLWHYTNQRAAEAVFSSDMLFVTPAFRSPNGTLLPRGGYATDINPYTPGITQRQLASTFYFAAGRAAKADVSWFVIIENIGDQKPPFVPIGPGAPHQWVAPAAPGVRIIHVRALGYGRNPMP